MRPDGPAASSLPPSEPREPAGDPVSNWLTFVGGSGADSAPNVAVDASGDSYVVGSSPAAWGSPVRGHAGGSDAFVARVDATGALRWLTFLGGTGGDYGIDVAVDGSGSVYVTGSSDATWGAPLVAHAGSADAFVARLDSGGVLQWHTFVGGTAGDFPTAIIRDPSGDLVVAGTSSATWGSPLNAHAGGGDAFVAKLDTSGTRQWNTFMGGIRDDAANGITTDQAGNVFATGSSKATWGTPINPFTLDNYADVFLARLSADGTRIWHTFQNKYSGLSSYGRKVAVALSGEIYVGGDASIGVTTWGFVRKFTAGGAYVQTYEFGTAAQTVMVSGLVLDPAERLRRGAEQLLLGLAGDPIHRRHRRVRRPTLRQLHPEVARVPRGEAAWTTASASRRAWTATCTSSARATPRGAARWPGTAGRRTASWPCWPTRRPHRWP